MPNTESEMQNNINTQCYNLRLFYLHALGICLCLQPDKAWHKDNDPKAD